MQKTRRRTRKWIRYKSMDRLFRRLGTHWTFIRRFWMCWWRSLGTRKMCQIAKSLFQLHQQFRQCQRMNKRLISKWGIYRNENSRSRDKNQKWHLRTSNVNKSSQTQMAESDSTTTKLRASGLESPCTKSTRTLRRASSVLVAAIPTSAKW